MFSTIAGLRTPEKCHGRSVAGRGAWQKMEAYDLMSVGIYIYMYTCIHIYMYRYSIDKDVDLDIDRDKGMDTNTQVDIAKKCEFACKYIHLGLDIYIYRERER